MIRMRLAIVGLGVALLGGALALAHGASANASIDRELLSREPLVVGAAASSYELSLATAITTDDGGVVARYRLGGRLELAPLGNQGGRRVVRASIAGASLSDVNFSNPDQRVPADFTAGFAKPCFITFEPSGAVAEVRVAPGSPSFAQTTWKAIAGLLQTSAPERPGQAAWDARERDAAGEYSVKYQREAAHLKKRKLAYLSRASALAATQEVTSAEADFTFQGGAVSSLRVHERVRATPAPPWPPMISELTFELRQRAKGSSAEPSNWRAEFDAATPSKLSDPSTLDSRRADNDRERTRSVSFDGLLAAARSEDKKTKLSAYQSLVSLLRVDETIVPRTAELVQKGDELSDWMIAALGDAGCDACQVSLAGLLSDLKLGASTRLSVLQSLGRVEVPSAHTLQVVSSLLDDLALGFQAKLSLGSIVFRLKDRTPAVAAEALAVLEARVRKGDSSEGLKAIGNAGSASSLPLLVEQLASKSTSTRAAAALALRRIQDPRVEALLEQLLTRETESQVKVAALEAARQRGISPGLLAATLRLVDNELDKEAQSAAVSVIGDWGPPAKSVAVEQALQRVIDHTEVDTLRDAAQRVLERVRGTG